MSDASLILILRTGRLYELEDIVKEWQDKLRGRASEPMVLHIIGVLDDYMHAFPLLAFVRGEAFTPEHWDTLFRTLEFQRTKGAEDRVTVESLTLGHFLDKADVLKQNEAALKNLAAQARGEVTIREALQEINVWGAETEFSLTEHAGGTPLIK